MTDEITIGEVRARTRLQTKNLRRFLKVYARNRGAIVGLMLVVPMILVAICGPAISPYDPQRVAVGPAFTPPGDRYYFGTDDLGRDAFSWVIEGARVSLLVGLVAAASSTTIGIAAGSIAGYLGRWFDDLLMRITEFFMIIPTFFLAILIVSIWGAHIWNIIFTIAVLTWPGTARLVRAEVLSLKERAFVEAARATGCGSLTILFQEILPNAMPSAIVNGSLQIANAILLEASLSFLGEGDPTLPSWGKMLSEGLLFIGRAWWIAVFPGIAISLTVIGLNLVGDGLNDALNPRQRGT